MDDVKKHICPTCGGSLIVNVERQMYECPFCGVTFDYDYFREENVLGIAAQALTNNEFTSAGRAYDFMLEKEPNNFEALRGKALIAMEIPKIDDIKRISLFSKLNFETANEEIERAIESSKPQDREYFTTMKDIVDAGHEYTEDEDKLKTLRDEKSKSVSTLSELVSERDTVFIYSSSRIRTRKAVFLTLFCYLVLCLIIFLGFKYFTRNPYSKAEDLSKYETTQTEDSVSGYSTVDGFVTHDISDSFINFQHYQEALEREEQRKINYDNWERNHTKSYSSLIVILCIATGVYAMVVLIFFVGGKFLEAEISKLQAEVDEQSNQIENLDKSMTELKERIKQGYERLCELHPAAE